MKSVLLLLVPLVLSACTPKEQELEGLKTYKYAGGNIQDGSLLYTEQPPVGGPYNPLWQNCGVYTKPIYNEYTVHSLARGTIWLSYQPSIQASELIILKSLIEGRSKIILSPYANQETPLAITAWNLQLKVSEANDARLKIFLDTYENNPQVPERGAECTGGYGATK